MTLTWTPEMDEALVRLSGTISREQIAERIGVHQQTVIRRQKALGITAKLPPGRPKFDWTPERDEKLRKVWANPRISIRDAERLFGISHVILWMRAKELKLGRKNHIWRQRHV